MSIDPPQRIEKGSSRTARGLARNPAPGATPEELVERCLAGDETSWALLVRRYAGLVHSTQRKYGLPETEQEEAFQAAFVGIHRQLAGLQHPAKLSAWIIGIAARQAINRIRARRRDVSVPEVTDEILASSPLPPEESQLPSEAWAALERAQQVRDGLTTLSDTCRNLLAALFLEEPTPDYREVGQRAGLAVGTIGPTRARCLERLRVVFRERGWL